MNWIGRGADGSPGPPGPANAERFSRGDRLRKRREFEECYASGSRVSGRLLQIFLLPEPGPSRLGISVPRRVGTATRRNRVRRRIREIFRRNRSLLNPSGVRMVVHARPAASEASFEELREEYRALLSRAPERKKSRS